jgi:DsbC/DsbD-like thiol-disulfide interchange protein
MHFIRLGRPFTALVVATLALIGAPGLPAVRAEGASPWAADMHSAARLMVGAPVLDASLNPGDATVLRAGIQIRLDPGWDTYWRYPGDSGVPPTFDFTGSENVKSVIVQWPAPQRFLDGAGGHSIGYFGQVLLPLRVIPNDAAQPATLRLKADYAVCADLCIPAKANLALALSGGIGANEQALLAAEARVPRRVALGAGGALAIRAIHRVPGPVHDRVDVEIVARAGMAVDLFVEGPTAEWSLPLPEPSRAMAAALSATRRFSFDLDGLPPGANAKSASLRFTVVSPNDAIEVMSPLD